MARWIRARIYLSSCYGVAAGLGVVRRRICCLCCLSLTRACVRALCVVRRAREWSGRRAHHHAPDEIWDIVVPLASVEYIYTHGARV